MPQADVTGDGIVTMVDFVFVANQLRIQTLDRPSLRRCVAYLRLHVCKSRWDDM